MHETPEGYLVCVGVSIARTGEMQYGAGECPIDPDPLTGIVTITRDEEEVFRPQTMASFEGKSITIAHPEDFLDPSNWSELTKGLVKDVRRGVGKDDQDLIADLLITDAEAIKLVKDGLREVSCGYDAVFYPIQGVIGRGVQKNIIGNHLALVDEGRAGSQYAINDHKGKVEPMKTMADRIRAIFAKAADEAVAATVTDAAPAKKDKDDAPPAAVSLNDVLKAVTDLTTVIGGPKAKDASTAPTNSEPAKVVADADPAAGAPASGSGSADIEARVAKMEAAMNKIMQMLSGEGVGDEDPGDTVTDDDGNDEVTDEDGDDVTDADPTCDDDMQPTMTGDTKSRIEILAPGFKARGKDAKAQALKIAYATKDGKAIIDQFTAGKSPDLKNENQVNTIFIAASEILKVNRMRELSGTKRATRDNSFSTEGTTGLTAEQVNKKNEEYYSKRTTH